jgi:aminoglycoside 6'-N-acetyltransferase
VTSWPRRGDNAPVATDPVHVIVHDRGRELAGAARPGESWAAAARRTCASLHTEPEPLDLSGETKRFVIDPDTRVAVRAMTRADLGDVVAWRSSAAVRRWWSAGGLGDPDGLAHTRAAYAERVDGLSPTRMWVIEVNGRSVGFVQDYRIGDYPDYALLGPDPGAIGVDFAIGADPWRGRGIGARVLWAWMLRAHARFPDATAFFAAPDHRNAASLRVLAKAGFTPGLWFDQPQEDGSTRTVVGCSLDVRRVIGPAARVAT